MRKKVLLFFLTMVFLFISFSSINTYAYYPITPTGNFEYQEVNPIDLLSGNPAVELNSSKPEVGCDNGCGGKPVFIGNFSYPRKLNVGHQGKHIVGAHNYDPHSGRSIFYGTMKDAEAFVKKFGGKGQHIPGTSKERLSFNHYIGIYKDLKGNAVPSKNAIIVWGKNGGHVYPIAPTP